MSSMALMTVLAAAACSNDKSPTNPSDNNTPKFTVTMNQANEFPVISNVDGSGSGSATITLHLTRDAAKNITAATADFSVTLTGFPAGTSLTGAHIHAGRPGTSGGISINTGLVAGDVVLANGAGSFTRNGINISPVDIAQNIVNDPIGWYFNVHTTVSPGGAVRGQLVAQ
jgi:hypothetical protein